MLQINLFGGTTVLTDAGTRTATDLGGVKPRQILEILAVAPGVPVSKERLAELLWEGDPPRSWVSTLEGYVCVLRRALRHGTGRRAAVSTVMRGYVLDTAGASVDLAEFRALRASAVAMRPERALEALDRAVALVTGELFPNEPYAVWAVHERTLVRAEVVEAAIDAAGHATVLQMYGRAAQLARLAIQHDPLAEGAWRLLMTALWRDGRRAEALRAYADLRDVLATELGAEPDRQSHELYLSLLRESGAREVPGARYEEVRLLLHLLRDVVGELSGEDLPVSDPALVVMAADVAGAA